MRSIYTLNKHEAWDARSLWKHSFQSDLALLCLPYVGNVRGKRDLAARTGGYGLVRVDGIWC